MDCKHTRLDMVTWKCRRCGVHIDLSTRQQTDYVYAEARAKNEPVIAVIGGWKGKAFPSGEFERLIPFEAR